jgi:hypothetical protein
VIAPRVFAWCFFAVWAVWLFALQAWLGREASAARWLPDLGLVLALSLLARAEVTDAPILAFVAALARSAFSAEPPLVLLTGFLLLVFLALAARTTIELSGPAWRAFTAFVLVLVFDAWLGFAHAMRAPSGAGVALVVAWPAALSSAACALLLGPALAHLPGLTPIRRRQW